MSGSVQVSLTLCGDGSGDGGSGVEKGEEANAAGLPDRDEWSDLWDRSGVPMGDHCADEFLKFGRGGEIVAEVCASWRCVAPEESGNIGTIGILGVLGVRGVCGFGDKGGRWDEGERGLSECGKCGERRTSLVGLRCESKCSL